MEDADGLTFRRALLIVNPVAGRGQGRRLANGLDQMVREALARPKQTCAVRMVFTSPGVSAEILARQALDDGADLVVAAGGDGTLHGVVNALAGSRVAVAQVPIGTGNDFARAVGVPLIPQEATGLLRCGRLAEIDIGQASGRRFVNVAGCGFDALVAERMNRRRRWLGGTPAYVLTVLRTLAVFRPYRMTLSVDGTTFEGEAMLCAIANGTSYGGGMRVAPDARWDDGLLDVCVVRAVGKLEFLRAFPLVFRGQHTTHSKVVMLRGSAIAVRSEPPAPVLLDGELIGTTPAEFTIQRGALRFVVPCNVPGRD